MVYLHLKRTPVSNSVPVKHKQHIRLDKCIVKSFKPLINALEKIYEALQKNAYLIDFISQSK